MSPTPLRRRSSRAFALLATGATVLAYSPLASAAPATSTQRVTVTEANAAAEQWAPLAYDCTADEYNLTPAQSMVVGPKAPPLGAGSREFDLSTPFGSVQTEIYRTTVLDDRLLSSVEDLQYSTYVTSLDDNAKQPAYLRLTVDTDPGQSDNERHALFFFPGNNGTVAQKTWQTWNVLDGDIDVDGDNGGTTTVAGFAASHPAARVVNNNDGALTGGGLSIASGCGGGNTRLSKANTDRVVVSAAAEGENAALSKMYDFERDNLSFAPIQTVTVDKSNEASQGFRRQGYQNDDSFDSGAPNFPSESSYVVGPETPPAGLGSLKFENANADGVQQLRTSKLDGTKVADLKTLDFSTYVTGTADEQPGYLKLDLDTDGDGTYDRSLFYYPANNGTVQRDAWQTWHAAAGKWNLDGDTGPDQAFSLDYYEAQFPGVTIVGRTDGVSADGCGLPECGGLSFQVGGSDTNTGGAYYLDRLVIGTATNSSTATQTLYDFEPIRPAITVTGPASVGELDSTNTYTVQLSKASDQEVTVDVDAIGGTATEGSDFSGPKRTITFAPGETEHTYTVNVLSDSLDENDETYTVQLLDASVGVIGEDAGSVTTTIADDDASPTIRVSDSSVSEPDPGTARANTFTVSLSQASGRTTSVAYATKNGTAAAPGDYKAASGRLTFAPGQTTKTVSVPVVADTVVEHNETYTLQLSAPSNLTVADATGVGTIVNDDTARVGMRLQPATGHRVSAYVLTNERQSNQTVQLVRTQGGKIVSARTYRLNAAGSLPTTVLPDVYSKGQQITMYARVVTPGGVFYSAPQTVTVT